MKVSVEFKRQDIWVGLYWKRSYNGLLTKAYLDVWLCLIPMLPIHLMLEHVLSNDEHEKVVKYMAGEGRKR
jgi:hypothetical protein